jgi:hypothetical protein
MWVEKICTHQGQGSVRVNSGELHLDELGKGRFPHKSAVKNRDDRTVERHVVSLIKKSALPKGRTQL